MHFIIWIIFALIFALLFNNEATAFSHRIDNVIPKFIVDVTSILLPPLRISLHLCTSYDDTIRFSREMSRYGLAHGIRNSNEDFDQRIYNHFEHQNLYALDLDCDYATETLQQAHSKRMFVAPAKWLLLQDRRTVIDSVNVTSTYNDTILEIFEDLAVYPDSEVLLARRLDGDFLELLSVYRPSPQRGVVWENRGNWTIENGLRLRDFKVASERRRNLQRTVLKVSIVLLYHNTTDGLDDLEDKSDSIAKATYHWVRYLGERMNATLSFEIETTWGYPEKNGSWGGMAGKLYRHDVDMAGTTMYMLHDRLHIVTYVQLYTRTRALFVFRRPLLSTVKNIFTLPFEQRVWIAIAVFLFLVSCFLYLSMQWEYYEATAKKSVASSNPLKIAEPTVSDNIFILLGAFSQQGYSYEPYKISTRISTLMLLVASLSLYAAYTANIVALLQSTTDSIKTPADILHSPLTLGVDDVKYNHYNFEFHQDPIRKAVYEQKILPNGNRTWMSIEEGIHRIRTETFAFYGPQGQIYHLAQQTFQEDEKCSLSEVDYFKLPYPFLPLPRQSPYLEIIKNGAIVLQEYGLKFREERRLYPDKPTCSSASNYITIGFTECYFAIVSLGYGILLSVTVFVFELLWYKIKNKDVRKKTTEQKKTVLEEIDVDIVEY
ncbi:probable glutamate receptor [Linepithema humile]|uniref:probable glutamate receptor n=1 Tax=Linepithema humile TaxID=83485 RepID=UPI00351EA8D2